MFNKLLAYLVVTVRDTIVTVDTVEPTGTSKDALGDVVDQDSVIRHTKAPVPATALNDTLSLTLSNVVVQYNDSPILTYAFKLTIF